MNAAPELYRGLWRHRYMIVLLTIVTTAIAYMQSSGTAKVYEASTLIRVEQPSSSTDPQQLGDALGVAQHLAQTYAQIVSTRAIADRVYTYLGGKGQRSEIVIGGSPVQDLELMYINAKSHIPSVAAAAANATPIVLRKFNSTTGGPRDKIVTINPATVPTVPISPKPMRTAFLALVVALVLNAGLALLFEFLRDRLPEYDKLEESFGKPVLATIPKLSLKQGSIRPRSTRGLSALPATPAKERA
jgi:succinoglycan biosynthesis transport protein ExoP